MNCRHCRNFLTNIFLDLGFAPPSNAYLALADLQTPELYYPLKLFVCEKCWLVQTEDYPRAEDLFTKDYAYFSSVSSTWLEHAKAYVDKIVDQLGLSDKSFVIEIASNDGYLLKNFIERHIPCLGIEPSASTAVIAEALGVQVEQDFFGKLLAEKFSASESKADLIIGNNVYAHVPDINDFTSGMKLALKPGGTITLEFPHLLSLLKHQQFDTVYHEHYSYLSLQAVCTIFLAAGLRVFDVEQLTTHGGSLRIYGCHMDDVRTNKIAVRDLISQEVDEGLQSLGIYQRFQSKADAVKNNFLHFLINSHRAGKTVAAYGAAAKGSTLLNYAGIKSDLISFVCDASTSKQGKYLPGSHIPILSPAEMILRKPDYVIILPWNLVDEIVETNSCVRSWGGQFVIPAPVLTII